jgi:hypothetical protein
MAGATGREREGHDVSPEDRPEITSTDRGGLHLDEDFPRIRYRNRHLDHLEGALPN